MITIESNFTPSPVSVNTPKPQQHVFYHTVSVQIVSFLHAKAYEMQFHPHLNIQVLLEAFKICISKTTRKTYLYYSNYFEYFIFMTIPCYRDV